MYKKDRRLSANRSVHHHDEKEVVMPLETIKEKLTNQEFEDSKTITGLREMKQEEFAGVVAQVENLRGRISEANRQVEGLFESLLDTSFKGNR